MEHNFKVNLPLAILITLIAVIYQRSTGPTYPKKFNLNGNKIKLLRSHGGTTDAPIELPKITSDSSAKLIYKRFPTNDEWTTIEFKDHGSFLTAHLPNQPPAGKIQYYIELLSNQNLESLGSKDSPIIIRFKGHVPSLILAPHIFFMFFSMLLAILAALEAFNKKDSFYSLTKATCFCLITGGMILGPLVQKYAFGVYWAGFPFDWDLTDNKLLIAVIAWTIALILNLKKRNRFVTIIAAIVLIGVYSIPHSMQGSQYNYDEGKVETDLD
ncbi:MAG: hypothetical protein HOJ35_00515 [Bdellovibrionales bacterium]|jgi:hypothetical protein|nr:hypothetical protein [Bdellovibrionales bacterium]